MEGHEITIDTEELSQILFEQLIKRGYAPSEDEVDEIADIIFDYLLEKAIIEEDVE